MAECASESGGKTEVRWLCARSLAVYFEDVSRGGRDEVAWLAGAGASSGNCGDKCFNRAKYFAYFKQSFELIVSQINHSLELRNYDQVYPGRSSKNPASILNNIVSSQACFT